MLIWALELAYVSQLFTNINIPKEEQVLFSDLDIRQLWNMLAKARSVLSMELTKAELNFPSFLKLLKVFCFLKEASIISLSFMSYA